VGFRRVLRADYMFWRQPAAPAGQWVRVPAKTPWSRVNAPKSVRLRLSSERSHRHLRPLKTFLLGVDYSAHNPTAPVASAANIRAGTDAKGNLYVLVNGLTNTCQPVGSPPFGCQDGQIDAVAPWPLQAGQQVAVCAVYHGAPTNSPNAGLAAAHPGVFMVGPHHAAALNRDGTHNSASNPAKVGPVVSIFGTDLGAHRSRAARRFYRGIPVARGYLAGQPVRHIGYAGPQYSDYGDLCRYRGCQRRQPLRDGFQLSSRFWRSKVFGETAP
jgi:uncharacterized protein (TIGR03437 family)